MNGTSFRTLTSIQDRIQARRDRGISERNAVCWSLAEYPTTKAQIVEYVEGNYPITVRKSWTIRQILVAVTNEIGA